MSQYQILHNILMQYTGMEFLDGCGDSSQPSKALDQPLFMPETGADGMLPTTLADISAGLGAISGSLFGEEHTPPTSTAAAAAAISFGMGCGFGSDLGGCGLSSSDSLSAGTSDDGSRTSGAPTQTVTPTACGSSPPPKAEVQKVVSVASEAPVGQREVMIEQLAFSTIPF
ncbi:hypothetical protein H4R19_006781 [Coemansia spiralis]|nr:hypothetical protein H4R19_006781 [Coemansia spiralis]